MKTVRESRGYGRKESIVALVDAVRGSSAVAVGPPVVTAREARNAQRMLDALLTSGGEWVPVEYD
eukprot:6990766-Prymnesium_polylepis.1